VPHNTHPIDLALEYERSLHERRVFVSFGETLFRKNSGRVYGISKKRKSLVIEKRQSSIPRFVTRIGIHL
jgi:hypothetical protein